jgi:RNA polymerase primary sigma factor
LDNEKILQKIKRGESANELRSDLKLLYEGNLPFIRKICRPYAAYVPLDDLLQESYFALLEAVDHFDPDKGKFVTCLSTYVKKTVLCYIANKEQSVRIPINYAMEIRRYKRFVLNFYTENGRPPTDDEVRSALKVSQKRIENYKKYGQRMESLDEVRQTENDTYTLADTLQSDFSLENECVDNLYTEYEKNELWGILERHMTDRERNILIDRFQNNMTLQQIADKNNLTRERIRQILALSLQKLKHGKASRELKEKLYIIENAGNYGCGYGAFSNHEFSSIVERKAMRMVTLQEEYANKYGISM